MLVTFTQKGVLVNAMPFADYVGLVTNMFGFC